MARPWIVNDAYFGQIGKLGCHILNNENLMYFIENVIVPQPSSNRNVLLPQFTNIYVLVASFDAQNHLRPGEPSWKDILDEEQYATLEKYRLLILGFMLVEENVTRSYDYIELIDTVVRGHHFGKMLMLRYEEEKKRSLHPRRIANDSAMYWAKIMSIDPATIRKEDIDDYIDLCDLSHEELEWDELYALCVE